MSTITIERHNLADLFARRPIERTSVVVDEPAAVEAAEVAADDPAESTAPESVTKASTASAPPKRAAQPVQRQRKRGRHADDPRS